MNKDPRWAPVEVRTVGELKEILNILDDNLPLVRLTNGDCQINKQDVRLWVGKISVNDKNHKKETEVECVRFYA